MWNVRRPSSTVKAIKKDKIFRSKAGFGGVEKWIKIQSDFNPGSRTSSIKTKIQKITDLPEAGPVNSETETEGKRRIVAKNEITKIKQSISLSSSIKIVPQNTLCSHQRKRTHQVITQQP